jgi:APA family basic amino acid/polyamine antiporter
LAGISAFPPAGILALLLNIDVLAELVSIGTLYVFAMVCAGVLFRRYHQPGSPYAANILWRIGIMTASSVGA